MTRDVDSEALADIAPEQITLEMSNRLELNEVLLCLLCIHLNQLMNE